MNEDEIEEMKEIASLVETVYQHKKGIPLDLPEGWRAEEYDSLRGVAINDDKKEVVLMLRGLMLDKDPRDGLILANMLQRNFRDDSPGLRGGVAGYQDTYGRDLEIVQEKLDQLKNIYSDYDIILAGHSRGGAQALHIGRRNKGTKTYAFASPQSEYEPIPDNYNPEDIKIYYTLDDIIPIHTRRQGSIADNEVAIDKFTTLSREKINSFSEKFDYLFGKGNDLNYQLITKPLIEEMLIAITRSQLKDPDDIERFRTGEKHYLIPPVFEVTEQEKQKVFGILGHAIQHFSKARSEGSKLIKPVKSTAQNVMTPVESTEESTLGLSFLIEPPKFNTMINIISIYNMFPNIDKKKLDIAFKKADKDNSLTLDSEEFIEFKKLISD